MGALGRDDETDCHGYLTNVDWSRGGGHPRSYTVEEVSAARYPQANTCPWLPGMCITRQLCHLQGLYMLRQLQVRTPAIA